MEKRNASSTNPGTKSAPDALHICCVVTTGCGERVRAGIVATPPKTFKNFLISNLQEPVVLSANGTKSYIPSSWGSRVKSVQIDRNYKVHLLNCETSIQM